MKLKYYESEFLNLFETLSEDEKRIMVNMPEEYFEILDDKLFRCRMLFNIIVEKLDYDVDKIDRMIIRLKRKKIVNKILDYENK